jgi:transposase
MGRTKGGLNTKIHAVVNARSQAIIIALSSGNEADISLAEELMECLPKNSTLICDKAYDSSALRRTAATNGVKTCIPGRTNRTTTVPFSAKLYRRRHRVENFFQRIKRYRRAATRYGQNAPKLSWASSASPSCSPFASHR